MLSITLLVPGLFDAEYEAQGRESELPALEVILARAKSRAINEIPYTASLCDLFQCEYGSDEDIPMAAIGRLIDGEQKPEGYWMRADPVHLHADQKSLNLVDVNNLALTQHDALALAASVRRSFTDQGWELEVPVPGRWYVKLNDKPLIKTSEIYSVIGRNIQEFMPVGEHASTWHRLMNEVQIQLHNADINRLRAERGELPVNSLWFWGCGKLPGLLERRWTRVYSDDNSTMGLSMLSNTPCLPLPADSSEILEQDTGRANILVVMSDFQTTMLQRGQARQRLLQFEKNWCSKLVDGLTKGRVNELRVLTRRREYSLGKPGFWKFWRKSRSFNSVLEQLA